ERGRRRGVARGRGPAGRARLLRVRLRGRGAPDLHAPRQHPPDARRHRVAVRARARRPAARAQVTALTRESLLAVLADGREHSGEDLARTFGVSRAAVWKQIGKLADW